MNSLRYWSPLLGLLASLLLVLAACAPLPTEDQSPIGTPAGSATNEPTVAMPQAAEQITNQVRQDLAERLNTGQAGIRVLEVRSVDWPDTSLGCPQPGMTYAQVVTPGYQIVLEFGGREYTYHTGDGSFVLCENGEPAPGKGETAPDEMNPDEIALIDKAKEDLTNRLKIAPDSIVLRSVEAVQWPNSSLGCPQPGQSYLTVVTPGYLIKLEAGERIYEYHSGQTNVVYCENPKAPLPAEPGSEVDVEARLTDLAKADLTEQLNIPVDRIEVVDVVGVEWPDASLGCPKPGMMYAQVVTRGYQIILSAQGKQYDYHSDLTNVFLCTR
jgi:hypothetical protein